VTGESDTVRFPLLLSPYETQVIVVGPMPTGADAGEPALGSATRLLELSGDWTVDLNGKEVSTPLETVGGSGRATLLRPGYLSQAVHGSRAWQPYRWDVTSTLRPGFNDPEIQVNASASGRMSFAPPPPTPAAGVDARGRGDAPQVSGMLGPVRLVTLNISAPAAPKDRARHISPRRPQSRNTFTLAVE
jgi:hypothetical protein